MITGVVLVLASEVCASYSTPDGIFMNHMAGHFRKYTEENDGRYPTSWKDLEKYTIQPIDEAYKNLIPLSRLLNL